MHELWHWVENKAFNPRNGKDKQRWLRCFHRFLPWIWEVEPDWNKPVESASSWYSDETGDGQKLKMETLYLKPLKDSEIGFYYSINKGNGGFSIRLFYSKGCFQIDYDDNYLYEFSKELKPNINVADVTREDIEQVIKKRIYHPALHTHLKKEDGGNYYHHLRFGFATNNPFVILYQVAFQIIDYQSNKSIMREHEISRIAETIYSNKNEVQISAGILFPH